uniref:Uncharacterized protein n=1 Tax=Anguilla anguilla TaxID=7936 RepID=A0A0E9RV87_ANGAN
MVDIGTSEMLEVLSLDHHGPILLVHFISE